MAKWQHSFFKRMRLREWASRRAAEARVLAARVLSALQESVTDLRAEGDELDNFTVQGVRASPPRASDQRSGALVAARAGWLRPLS